jgi:arylsulfatase A-like enzyme
VGSQVLQRAGYKTAALGKWHLGMQSNAYTPTFRGFDTYTGYYAGAEEHFTHYKAGEGKNYFDLANNSGSRLCQPTFAAGCGGRSAPLFLSRGHTQRMQHVRTRD